MLHWRCDKPLPKGLVLHQTVASAERGALGSIRGVPSTPGKSSEITLIATNSRGEASVKMDLQVRGLPPPAFGYEERSMMLVVGAPYKGRLFSIGKGAIGSYSVSPDLPPGLALDTVTGVIMEPSP